MTCRDIEHGASPPTSARQGVADVSKLAGHNTSKSETGAVSYGRTWAPPLPAHLDPGPLLSTENQPIFKSDVNYSR